MAIRIGINGFGRIGRTVFRIIAQQPERFELCGINLRNLDMKYVAYTAQFDSVHGCFPGSVRAEGSDLIVNGKRIHIFGESDPANIDWGSVGADYVIESTGAFNTTAAASAHLKGGAKKVIITAPAKDEETPTFVFGVNHTEYDPKTDIVSAASCTTNCLAPLAKVVNDRFGIERGLMSTIHSATAKQKAVDSRAGSRDLRTGRSVFNNIIPSTTGAAKAVGKAIPELNGKLTGMSFRVPVNDVSVVDLTAKLVTKTCYADIMSALDDAAATNMKGILTCLDAEVVSSDLRGNPYTCIVDKQAGIMLGDDFVKLIAWYDNEWGYSTKVLDLTEHISRCLA